jgi:hypothetical protein
MSCLLVAPLEANLSLLMVSFISSCKHRRTPNTNPSTMSHLDMIPRSQHTSTSISITVISNPLPPILSIKIITNIIILRTMTSTTITIGLSSTMLSTMISIMNSPMTRIIANVMTNLSHITTMSSLSLEVLASSLSTRHPSPACLFRLQKGHTLRLE